MSPTDWNIPPSECRKLIRPIPSSANAACPQPAHPRRPRALCTPANSANATLSSQRSLAPRPTRLAQIANMLQCKHSFFLASGSKKVFKLRLRRQMENEHICILPGVDFANFPTSLFFCSDCGECHIHIAGGICWQLEQTMFRIFI
jgi:hypothetical protein